MAADSGLLDLEAQHRDALAAAVATLEHPNLAARIADFAGAPINRVLAVLPRVADRGLVKTVELTMMKCLQAAIRTLDDKRPRKPRPWVSSMAAGVTGGLGGFLGVASLPFELPVTTTLMLRAVADIARHNGEDLTQLDARLACLQVFGLGARTTGGRTDIGYFAARAMLTKASGNAVAGFVERSGVQLTAPMMSGFVSELASRFSIVVSDRIAASSLPVIGAIGGATVNLIFMNHFQRIAEGHFTVRRLERRYGPDLVRRHYAIIAAHVRPGHR
jgi:hypothetical protein